MTFLYFTILLDFGPNVTLFPCLKNISLKTGISRFLYDCMSLAPVIGARDFFLKNIKNNFTL